MGSIITIAINTFREFIRDRIIYSIFIVSVLFLVSGFLLSQLTYIDHTRIALSLGLAGLELSIIILSIFLGSTIIFREIEKQTVFTLLIRPITRGSFLMGKFLGLYAVVFSALFFLSLILIGILLYMEWTFDSIFLAVIYGFALEAAVLISITILLGVIVRPTLTVPLTIGVLLIGKWTSTLEYFLNRSDNEILKLLTNVLPYIIPNFERWDWKSAIFQETFIIDTTLLTYTFFYAISWIFVLQAIAHLIFRRKDLA